MGSVRIHERFFQSDPPTPGQIGQARTFVDALIDSTGIDFSSVGTWLGVAGTCTALSAINLGLTKYDRSMVHNSSLDVCQIESLADQLLGSSLADIEAEHPLLDPMRAEVIAAGALICQRIAQRVRIPLIVRETDILNGAAMELLS
jgi:exopolyphosphatase/guanosine-5'-triphosphate,3'-diphosphate pyrophosphatase